MAKILAAASGIISIGFISRLPPVWVGGGLVLFCVCLLWRFSSGGCLREPARWVAAFSFGAGWGVFYGHSVLDDQLAPEFNGKDFFITGEIVGLPRLDTGSWRFEFKVLANGDNVAMPEKLRLSWYLTEGEALDLVPGEIWHLKVRLKRPRGFVNPGGFDYQGWLLANGIGATGYVRKSRRNFRLQVHNGISVSAWRHWLRVQLDSDRGLACSAVLKALAIGDRSALSTEQWALFQRTGTSHLMAISGLHIGLLASLGYFVGRFLGTVLLVLKPYRGITRYTAAICAAVSALLYSALAGFSLPTQRALIMVLVANLAFLSLKPVSGFRSWSLALLGVLLLAPLAGHNPGFWLSFCAVGVLLLVFSGTRFSVIRGADAKRTGSQRQERRSAMIGQFMQQHIYWRVWQLLLAQWTTTLGLLLPLLVLGLTATAASPLANPVAIPLVSWGVVPPLLLGLVLLPIWPEAGWELISWADLSASFTLEYLQWCDQLALPSGRLPFEPGPGTILLGAFGVFLLLLPRGVPDRWLGLICLLSMFLPRLAPQPPLTLTVLDVGQGLAVVAQAFGRTLVFDTGPEYSERFDAGSGIVAPFLHRRGIRTIEKLIVSHGDGDHSGGLGGLIKSISVQELLWGERLAAGAARGGKTVGYRCQAGQQWAWGKVSFRILSPPAAMDSIDNNSENNVEQRDSDALYKGNNASCVLLIQYGSQSILLPGDIEEPVERRLVAEGLPQNVSVLLAPHHGSLTSSSSDFVRRLQPRIVIFSAGFRNRYGHPHDLVIQRYRPFGSVLLNTADAGAVSLVWERREAPLIQQQRLLTRRYWFTELAH